MSRSSDYQALTFDCYGTLIDWRRGLVGAVRACPGVRAVNLDENRFLARRQALEAELESGPYCPYRKIVAGSVIGALAEQGIELPGTEAEGVAASVGEWEPFPEVPAALEALGAGRELAIVSNVDRRDIERSVQRLGVPFAVIVTAEEVRSYKPARAHFNEVLRRLGLPRESVLHVAQSLYHDIHPVTALGGDSAWVNRLAEPLPPDLSPRFQVPDLASLATTLGPRAAGRP
jgi:2-haloacid dehalogenase